MFHRQDTRIREADTQRLQLWDAAARRQTALQLLLALALFCAHLAVSSREQEELFGSELESGGGCVEDGSNLQTSDRGFYAAQGLLLFVLVQRDMPFVNKPPTATLRSRVPELSYTTLQ